MRRFWAGCLVGALALSACGGGDNNDNATDAPRATTTVAPTTSTTVPRPETYDVETREEVYVDASRPTQANGDYGGAPDRTIRTVFHVPQGDGPFPVVVFGHGWIATPEIYASVLDQIASKGYLVVAPAYPLSNGAAPGGPSLRDLRSQPGDASFVLDQVIAANDDASSWLFGLADPEHIAVGGHSYGGFTAMGFYNSCCTDDRVDAVFPIAAAKGNYEGEWWAASTPLLVIHGDNDELVQYAGGVTLYEEAAAPKYFLTLLGQKHAPFATEPDSQQVQISVAVILDFLDGHLRGNEDSIAAMATTGNVEGVSTLVSTEEPGAT